MADAALSLQDVSKSYGDFEAVRGLSFSVRQGAICGFLGPNGAGKTSTLRMILGLSRPSAGEITVLGGQGAKAMDRIGFLPEERGLYRKMTAIDTIVFLGELKGMKASLARRRGREMLERHGLDHAAKKQIRTLSKGMSQKVQLIASLVHEPELVILDEPFSGLDPVNQQSLEEVIQEIAGRGGTVLFSTHIMQHAERLCRDVVMLSKGRKVFDGTLRQARAVVPRSLEVEGRVSAEALAALPGVSQVRSAGMSEEGVPLWHCELVKGASPHATLKAAFLSGLDITRFEAREPSLHEAFIALTGGEHA